MTRTSAALGAALTLLLLLPSCFIVTHDYDGAREVTPGTVLSQPSEQAGAVDGSKRAFFLFWGLLPINSISGPQLAEDLAVESYGTDFQGITKLKIHEEAGALDVAVTIVTLGIFSMRSVEIEGYVEKTAGGTP